MERALGLMCGAGTLPAHVASEARRQGWRVVAFAFGEAPALAPVVDRLIPSRLPDLSLLLDGLRREQVSAVVFVGKMGKRELLEGAAVADASGRELLRAAGGLSDGALGEAIVGALAGLGIEVLDQRLFLGSLLVPPGLLTSKAPSEAEWRDIRLGLRLAKQCAGLGVGQTVVVKQGIVVAVEGIEGTNETISRGCRLAGPGAVVVKAVAPQQDYRFDVPAVGPATLEALAEGEAGVLAVEGGKVMVLDRERVLDMAARHEIAVVSLGADAAQ
ncbi:MAG: LpxI family protein [Candidatus Rokubacteria bacterium]|nr:LpxI family protein [Candidatus Rokubacteria bacterium]